MVIVCPKCGNRYFELRREYELVRTYYNGKLLRTWNRPVGYKNYECLNCGYKW